MTGHAGDRRRSAGFHRLPRSFVRRAIPLALAMAALGAACGGGDGEDAATTTSTRTESTTTSTTAPTTTVAAEGPEEWVRVAQDLNRREFELLEDPNPDELARLYAESCECWQERLDTVEFLAERNEHFEGQPTSVLYVRYEGEFAAGDLHRLTVKAQANAARRVDEDGGVVQELPAGEQSCVSLGIRSDGAGGAWRIYSRTPLPACPEGG